MMHAFHGVMNELVLLGFLSFMLEIFGPEITKICIDMYAPNSMSYWFARCPINYIGHNAVPSSAAVMSTPFLFQQPAAGSGTQFFAYDADEGCDSDKQPFASQQALHEIHYLLFLIGISRVLAIISLVYASHMKLGKWAEDLKTIKVIRKLEGMEWKCNESKQVDGVAEPPLDGDERSDGDDENTKTDEENLSLQMTPITPRKTFTTGLVAEDIELDRQSGTESSGLDDAPSSSESVGRKALEVSVCGKSEKPHNESRKNSIASTASHNSSETSPRSSSLRGSSLRSSSGRRVLRRYNSTENVVEEHEQSWMRINNLQMRRFSQETITVPLSSVRHGETVTPVGVIVGSDKDSCRTSQARFEPQELTIRESSDYLDMDHGDKPTETEPRTSTGSKQGDLIESPEAGDSASVTNKRGREEENAEGGSTESAVQSQAPAGEPPVEKKKKAMLQHVLCDFFPDVTRRLIMKRKKKVFMKQLMDEQNSNEKQHARQSGAKAGGESTANANGQAERGAGQTSTCTTNDGRVWPYIRGVARNVYYSIQLQTLLFLRQFTHGVTRGDVDEARKSFIRKHELPCEFNFLTYTSYSVDEDLAEVIEVHWIEWTVGLLYLFGVGVDDVLALQFWIPLLGLILISLVGLQIQNVMFHVAALRIDDEHTTDSHFWFGKPRNMLWMLRISTSIFSFTLAFTYFVTWKEGLHSCYFDLWGMSWSWVLFNSVVTLVGTAYIGFRLLPQYSLAVEMGSHYRQDILRQLLVEDKVRASEEEVQKQIDDTQRLRQSSLTSDDCLLVNRRRSLSQRDVDFRLSGKQTVGILERTPSALTLRPRKRMTHAPMWQRQAAATEIQRRWRQSREAQQLKVLKRHQQ